MKMDRRAYCRTAVVLLGGLASRVMLNQESNQLLAPEVELFEAKTFTSPGGAVLLYRLYVPKPPER